METSSALDSSFPTSSSSASNSPSFESDSKKEQNEFFNLSRTINPMSNTFRNQVDNFIPAEARQKLKESFEPRLLILFIYLIVTTFLSYQLGFELLNWWVGGIIGFFLLDTDYLLDIYFLHPHSESSRQIKNFLKARNWRKVCQTLLFTTNKHPRMVLHSILFEAIIVLLAIYVITSKGGAFSHGLILAFWFRVLFEQTKEFLHTGKMDSWFWQIKDPVSTNLQSVFLAIGIIVWIITNIARL